MDDLQEELSRYKDQQQQSQQQSQQQHQQQQHQQSREINDKIDSLDVWKVRIGQEKDFIFIHSRLLLQASSIFLAEMACT